MRNQMNYGISPELETIPSILRSAGYVNIGFVNSALLSTELGFGRNFDHYSLNQAGHGMARETVDSALAWLTENAGNSSPRLMVIHLYDVHAPYDPPEGYDMLFSPSGSQGLVDWTTDSMNVISDRGELDHLVDMYDGEIAWVDAQIGRFLEGLRVSGRMDNAIVIVTSDHGEEFLEHGGWSHGHTLYQELLFVPLIVSGSGISAGAVDNSPAGHFDILPTIAGYAGITLEQPSDGTDLFHSPEQNRVIPSSGAIRARSASVNDADFESLCAVLCFPSKGIINFQTMEEEAYDLTDDPYEQNAIVLDPVLRDRIEYYWSTPPRTAPPVIESESLINDLNDLGYVR